MKNINAHSGLRVLLISHDSLWVAQCLEYDITGQGDTIEEALAGLKCSIFGHAISDVEDGLPPLHGISPAPPWCFQEFTNATPVDIDDAQPESDDASEPARNHLKVDDVMHHVPPAWMIHAKRNGLRELRS